MSLPGIFASAILPVAPGLRLDDPTVARECAVECATPAAVTSVVLTVEFAAGSHAAGVNVPEYVSTGVLVSTLPSVPLLTGPIALLQSGLLLETVRCPGCCRRRRRR